MLNLNLNEHKIITVKTRHKILGGVVTGHLLVLLLVLTAGVVGEWFQNKEDTINVVFYDPQLDNVVENPSPLPDPNNPIPPSGTQDGSPEQPAEPDPAPQPEAEPEVDVEPAPEAEVNPTPAKVLVPETPQAIKQPKVKSRKLPKPKVNTKLPKALKVPSSKAIKQPKAKRRKLPSALTKGKDTTKNRNKTPANNNRSKGPLGSNLEGGHTAPGGQRGNSDYAKYVGYTIKRMWVTPDRNRLPAYDPAVTIEVHIAGNGMITAKRIVRKSNVLAMDESISALLNSLYRVNPPPDRKACTLLFTLKIDD